MSTNINLNTLWDREESSIPDVQEIFAKGAVLQSNTRNRLLFSTILPLILMMAFAILIWLYRQPQMITTDVGVVVIIGAMAFFIITAMRYLNLLNKNSTGSSTKEFLLHFLKIKRTQESLATTMLSIYFALMAIGLTLCMIEYLKRFGLPIQLSAYCITFTWIAFNWFYLIPKMVKKQREKMNLIIEKLEEIYSKIAAEE